ncbi:MAG: hypothetical protein JO030_01905 [Candidatus Eremiobacteraeota bacterium]|nr:hypothetical protein [Candidatus Eremiobacteraeota bacterium]
MLRATVLSVLTIASCMASAPQQTAAILNTGSTNTHGYKITVAADGTGTAVLQNRDGSAAGSVKAFHVPPDVAARFFADLAAARKNKTATVHCMKSASFGSSTHVTWEDWQSADLDCPPADSYTGALIKDVEKIRDASGIPAFPLRQP